MKKAIGAPVKMCACHLVTQ